MGRPTTEILNCNIMPNPKPNFNHYSYSYLCLYHQTIRWPRSKRKSKISLLLLYPSVHNCRCSSLTPYPSLLTRTGSFFFSTFHFHQTCIDWWRWNIYIFKKTAWGARGTTTIDKSLHPWSLMGQLSFWNNQKYHLWRHLTSIFFFTTICLFQVLIFGCPGGQDWHGNV